MYLSKHDYCKVCRHFISRDSHQLVWPHLPTFLTGSSFGIFYVMLKDIELTRSIWKLRALRLFAYLNFIFLYSQASGKWMNFIVLGELIYSWFFNNTRLIPTAGNPEWGYPYTTIFLGIFILLELLNPTVISEWVSWGCNDCRWVITQCYGFMGKYHFQCTCGILYLQMEMVIESWFI